MRLGFCVVIFWWFGIVEGLVVVVFIVDFLWLWLCWFILFGGWFSFCGVYILVEEMNGYM